MKLNQLKISKYLFFILGLFCLSGFCSAPVALALGLVFALLFGNPFSELTHKMTRWLLQISVVALGFGMNLWTVFEAGKNGFWVTFISISLTLLLGFLIGRSLKVEKKSSLLIASGTAICGGSAIAAVGSVIQADKKEMSVSLASIFILNAVALFIFPVIGHWLGLSQSEFGLWAAVSIHDTSSVVGAAAKYGDASFLIATTIKLTRVIWIIPMVLILSLFYRSDKASIKIPYFIIFFIAAAALTTFFPSGEYFYRIFQQGGKLGLTLTLFFIGLGLSKDALKTVGFRPMLMALILWIFLSIGGLIMIKL